MSAPVYEVAGAINASLADQVTGDDDTILVEQDDGSELLIAQPKPDNGGDA
jgi:hypothetical protein